MTMGFFEYAKWDPSWAPLTMRSQPMSGTPSSPRTLPCIHPAQEKAYAMPHMAMSTLWEALALWAHLPLPWKCSRTIAFTSS